MLPVVYQCSATFRNCTIANNLSGIKVHTASFENCILYHNRDPLIYLMEGAEFRASYSDIDSKESNSLRSDDETFVLIGSSHSISQLNTSSEEPHFVRLGEWRGRRIVSVGDYHLKSEGWRWSDDLDHGLRWVFDAVTSPGIDGGDPESGLGEELVTVPSDPDGKYGANGRINMGVYGGTYQASLAPPPPPGRRRR